MIHVGDVGTVIRVEPSDDTDLSGASSAEIRYKKPSGATGAWTASIVSDGVQYTTTTGDIDEAGTWYLQAYVDLGSWVGSSTIQSTKIGGNLGG